MVSFFINLNPLYQAIIATTITFLLTTLGAACIFLFKNISKNFMNKLLSISAGIMLSSLIFSLLIPAIENANNSNFKPWIICSIGILLGTMLLYIGDKVYSKRKKNTNNLITSITLHNIPEGMAIGVAFASVYYNNQTTIVSAIILAIGIGIQNFPEGSAISFPLYNNGYSKIKAFIIGSLTAIVEPLGAILGVLLAIKSAIILPLLLSFASGAMLYVIITELIPETMTNNNKEELALYLVIGFIIMMILDISLG